MESKVFVIGEPETGKSNYLGRCWIAIDGGHSSLKLSGLPEDLAAIRMLADSLLAGNYSQHTKRGSTTELILNVSDRQSEEIIGILSLPDFSGEDCEIIITKRRWSAEWERSVQGATGILIFIRGEKISPSIDWCEAQKIGATELMDGQDLALTFPSDVVLVELLQMISEARGLRSNRTRLKLGLVISCWDALPLEMQQVVPAEYVSENLKLLDQFLSANADVFDIEFFGLSSTGGDLLDPNYKAEYLKDPQSAGYIVQAKGDGGAKRQPDVTAPMRWVLTESR